jgi:hypothetical protein
MVQLNEVATQVKSRIETVITKIKNQDQDRTYATSTSSASPRTANPESLNHQTAKVVDAVFSTLFGACSGNTCNTNDDTHIVTEKFQKKTILNKEQRARLQTLKTSGSNIESRYAQYYQDDHGRAARAVLMASEREEKEKKSRRQQWQAMNRQAQAQAMVTSMEDRKRNRRRLGAVQTAQHREHIQVNGNPLSLSEVNQSVDEESESGASYNYDDGISALSAHTLEEMAKIESSLQKQRSPPMEPQEQGFDISIDQIKISPGPPSPTGTEESGSTVDNEEEKYRQINDIQENEHSVSLHTRQKYPVQMARNQSNTDSNVSSSFHTSKSEFTDIWKSNERQYWSQAVEDDSPSKVRISSIHCQL